MTLKRGEIIWVNFNPQKGHEQAGRRPAVVISPEAYNALSNCLLVCPITSNVAPWPWKVTLPEGGKMIGAILVDQIKSIDARARHCEPTGETLDTAILDDVLARLQPLLA